MRGLALAVVFVFCFGAVSSWADSPGTPGPTMYTLDNVYDYLTSGTEATAGDHSMEPPEGTTPGEGGMINSLADIYDDVKAEFDKCAVTTAGDVRVGYRFFCTNPGSWGVQTGTFYCAPTQTPSPTSTPTNTPIPTNTPTNTPIPTNTPPPTPTHTDPWYRQYGPGGQDLVVEIGGMYVAKWTNNAGTDSGATKNWSTAVSWGTSLNWCAKNDWWLPTKDELDTICDNKSSLGAYKSDYYWSPTEYSANRAWCVYFYDCFVGNYVKTGSLYVRAVRAGE